jgi:RNA polymerase sigma-70 factor (ECF subfamily)
MNENKLNIDPGCIRDIVKGSGDAFKRLFTAYCGILVHFAHRYVQDVQVAENLVQEVFVKIWGKRERLDPEANIKSYLFTAVKNEALKHLRHAKVVNKNAGDILHIQQDRQQSNGAGSPEKNLDDLELAKAVQEAVAELPEKTRLVFSMSKYDQLTYAQIAEILEISIKTVETHMGRALKFLRQKLVIFFPGFCKGKDRGKG